MRKGTEMNQLRVSPPLHPSIKTVGSEEEESEAKMREGEKQNAYILFAFTPRTS